MKIKNIIEALTDLGVSKQRANKSVNNYTSRVNRLITTGKSDNPVEQIVTIFDVQRMNAIINKWKDMDKDRQRILGPKTQFEKIINSLFSGKTLNFDDRNMPLIKTESNPDIGISSLSSGEKQLFILLGEALLQEPKPIVFISDEPELSLHVEWQSTLFQNIRILNPSCQIITATYSPDIVGKFQNKIIEIEDCIKNV